MMRKTIFTIVALLSLTFAADAQDTVQHRLFPGVLSGQKHPRQSKDELQAQIDSLNALVRNLQQELGTKDSLHAEMSSKVYDAERRLSERVTVEYTHEMTDSLINVLYVNRQMSEFQDIREVSTFMSDSMRFTTNVPDSVLIDRLRRMNSYISLPFNATVKNYMVLYSEKNTAKMRMMLSKASYYFPIFEETLNRYDLPDELKYMAIIESALNPTARSRAGARGIWQFMHITGKQYGLKINSYVDERLDVEKAADAAARYLQDSYKVFGDWALAISSYNCGVGNVNKAIKRAGGRRDFWSIYPYLPRETRGYMPAFVGAMYAMTYYREYGIVPDPPMMPAQTDTFHINRNLHFQQINDLVGVPMETIREINPQYIHDIIPGNEGDYVLKLPYNYTNGFLDVQDTLYAHKADTLLSATILKSIEDGTAVSGNAEMIRYKVKSGDYLGKLASRYHVSVAQIKKWNHLKSNDLRVGQVLTIYKNGVVPAPAPAQKPVAKPEPAIKPVEPKPVPVPASVETPLESDAQPVTETPDSNAVGANVPEAADSTNKETATAVAEEAEAAAEEAVTEEEPAKPEYETYKVKAGDSLYSISRKFGTTVTEMQNLNGISGSKITVGMTLKVPAR